MSCEKAIMTMQAVLKRTQENALSKRGREKGKRKGREGRGKGGEVIVFLLTVLSNGATTSVQHIELQLVDSKKDIESPPPFHSTNNHNPLDDY